MKKFTIALLLLVATAIVYGQSPRMVIHEEFTSSTCGPCASANPTFHTWMVQHPDIYTSIFWHCNWPSPGNDPMYLANTVDNGSRISYYAVNSIPWAFVDGNVYGGIGSGLSWSVIQNRSTVPSPFEVHMQHQLNATQDSIQVTMLLKCTQAVTAAMVAHNVVIEKYVHFTTAPGTNGEKDFYNVMKKMLPDKDGTNLPASYAAGDYSVMQYSWKLANVYDNNQLAAISFVQNKSTKEIYQAGNSATTAITMPYTNDVEMMQVSNYSTTNCSGKISPVVQIRNNGNATMTSLEIKYQVNNEPVSTYTWSGSLATLKKATVTLPVYSFNPMTSNTLKIYSNKPNNVNDEYPKNDTATVAIASTVDVFGSVYVSVRTDNAPAESTWDIRDDVNTVIGSGGPYALSNHLYKDTVDLPTPGCYTFTIYDAGGNGLCCGNGTGVYYVTTTTTPSVLIKSGSTFGNSEFTEFGSTEIGIRDLSGNDLTVYPNPFHGSATISFTNRNAGHVTISLYNSYGQLVKTIDKGMIPSGNQEMTMDAADLSAGVYILKLQIGGEIITKKIAVEMK